MEPTGLILEGGGMRGLYTAGVLEYFAEQNLYFPYQIGVSAGACMAVSYLSRQRGRNKRVNVEFAGDPRYLSWRQLLRRKELFGMDFIFGEIPNRLVPFDFNAFGQAEEELVVGTTDIETGSTLYFSKNKQDLDMLTVLRASSSLPFFAPIVEYEGRKLMDGGISDPIPIHQAEKDGYRRNVLILTRNAGYAKSPSRLHWMLRKGYGEYPAFIQVMLRRHEIYNEAVAYAERQEKEGSAFIIRPELPLKVGRVEQNKKKLEQLYQQGYEEAKKMFPNLLNWLNR